ncbi:hypothetical protein [Streptomyces huasconensis]|uniref:hypothetical protein n=1 Tax=Streptomyces huasconensis TaxID=1854574 RepID=UPI0036FEBFFA
MERPIEEARRIRRGRLASEEPGIDIRPGPGMVIFYSVCFTVPLTVAVGCLALGSEQLLSVALIMAVAAVVAVRPLLVIVADGIRGRLLTRRVRRTLGAGLPERVHAVRFGLHDQNQLSLVPWDTAPVTEGAISVEADGLHLYSAEGSQVVSLTDVWGAVLVPGRRFTPERFDIYLRSGEAFEVSTMGAGALGAEMSAAGIRVLREL